VVILLLPYLKCPLPKPTSSARPVLPATLPEYSFTPPPTPVLMLAVPVMIRLPPVVVPAAAFRPAVSINAMLEVPEVVMFWATVKSPTKVLKPMLPPLMRVMPLTAPTVPTVSALLLI
jgi:hypothetical protein